MGNEESYLLQKSLKQLATTTNATSMRFFGKFTATTADYFVAEATVEAEAEGEEEEKDPLVEEPGTGVNKFTYFATNSPFEKWVKLPNLKPSILATARKIRYMLSGNLENPII